MPSSSSEVEVVLRANAVNGERPGWSARERRLWWVDIRAPALHRFDPATGRDQAWGMPDWIGCYGLSERGAAVALRTGLFEFDAETGGLEFLAPPPYDPRRFCFNDGRCDRQGRFFAGPMHNPLEPGPPLGGEKAAPLWRYDGAGRWSAVSQPVSNSNGLAWSPDGRTLYHADTTQKTIWAWDYDPATGSAENRRVFARVEAGGDDGGPDGATVDRDGFYLCAVSGAGCLMRFDPDGRLERRIDVPTPYPTMPAYGGADLSTVYVTSLSWLIPEAERPKHPEAGALFAFEAPVPGLPEALFTPDQQASSR